MPDRCPGRPGIWHRWGAVPDLYGSTGAPVVLLTDLASVSTDDYDGAKEMVKGRVRKG
jgi:hypothetical protein